MRKSKKKNVVLYLDPEVVKEAKKLGLNLSKVCENALKEAIKRLKEKDCNNIAGPVGFSPTGLEPTTYGLEGRRAILLRHGPIHFKSYITFKFFYSNETIQYFYAI